MINKDEAVDRVLLKLVRYIEDEDDQFNCEELVNFVEAFTNLIEILNGKKSES